MIKYSYNLELNVVTIHKDLPEIYEFVYPNVEINQDQFLQMRENIVNGSRYKLIRKKLVLDSDHDIETKKRKVIFDRNNLLMSSDWTMLQDVSLSDETREKWKLYRQALRDITSHPNFPDVEFPKRPE